MRNRRPTNTIVLIRENGIWDAYVLASDNTLEYVASYSHFDYAVSKYGDLGFSVITRPITGSWQNAMMGKWGNSYK